MEDVGGGAPIAGFFLSVLQGHGHGSTPIEDEDDDEYADEQPPLTNHFSPLTFLVSELKSDYGRKCIATRGRREFCDLLTRFFHGLVHDRVARAIHDSEFRHGSIRLNLEAHIDNESCTGGNLTMRLVPSALKPVLDNLSVKTDVCFAVAGCRPVFLSLAVPGSLLMFIGLSGTAPFPVLLLCV
jgi:hypothetical protein